MKAEDSLPKKEWWISTIMNNCLQKTLFCVGIIWSIMLSILSLLLIPAYYLLLWIVQLLLLWVLLRNLHLFDLDWLMLYKLLLLLRTWLCLYKLNLITSYFCCCCCLGNNSWFVCMTYDFPGRNWCKT